MRAARRICVWLVVASGIATLANAIYALNPGKALSQYMHESWNADKGFPGGAVFAICQSQDGYLWIGTERGLVRFDGFEFLLIQRPITGAPLIGAVRGLVADAYGNLWIRLDGPHLLRYREGRFEDVVARYQLEEIAFTAMSIDGDGELIVWGPKNRMLRFHNGQFQHCATSDDLPGIVVAMTETHDGQIWMGTRDIGLVLVRDGKTINLSDRLSTTSVNALLPIRDGKLWIGTDAGLQYWDDRGLALLQPPLSDRQRQVLSLTKDRNGNVWVGTDRGLVRITPSMEVVTAYGERGSIAGVNAIYEDRDGDIWFGGPRGIERLRDGMFTGYSTRQGLPAENNGPIYVDSERRTWFAPASGGLYWLKDNHVSQLRAEGLADDVIYSISGGPGEIWVGRQHGGLTVLRSNGDSFAARTYTTSDGLAANGVYAVHRCRDGTVWAGTVGAGISRLQKGVFTNYSVADGLASNAVFSIVEGYSGIMWFATPSGLQSFANDRWKTYIAPIGLFSANTRSLYEDSKHLLWIGTSGGLAYLDSDHLASPGSLPNSLREDIFGIAEDRLGSLWIVTSDHVLQVSRDRLLSGSLADSDVQSFGLGDGLPGVEGVSRDRSILSDLDGHIWISLTRGLATSNPTLAAKNATPVSVRIESISAEGKAVYLSDAISLPAGTHSITFNFAGSRLTNPQRLRFRYVLDGAGQRWNEIASRQVVFTNLGPGSYRFRIVGSSGAGLWNGPEAAVRFEIKPAFWQTWWFQLACLASCGLLVMAIYRLRMSQMTRRLNTRFQDRLAERTRIAQDLHDTLLQGVLSASMQLDVVEDLTPHDSPAKPLLKRVLQLMSQVTEEGRSALRGLRIPGSHTLSLEAALSRIHEEFALSQTATYRVGVQGHIRPLNPIIRDEAYRITREAAVNAFLHAQADSIEVKVEYASRWLCVVVTDNGCGMEAHVLKAGREGHWGLPGMRERSEAIGATLRLRSRIGAGTEVELVIPSALAFQDRSSPQWPG